eukprot:6202377-Pleurochrysis_carterae.AAC.6
MPTLLRPPKGKGKAQRRVGESRTQRARVPPASNAGEASMGNLVWERRSQAAFVRAARALSLGPGWPKEVRARESAACVLQ